MAGDGNRPRLCGVMKLAVAAFGASETPTVLFKPLDHISDFHLANIVA
jgi:hypothetical protein